jgi:hypothetical protein
MRIKNYPTITKALLIMAYDNGVVNRSRTEKEVLEKADNEIADQTDKQLSKFENELAQYSESDLDTICAGDQDDPTVKSVSSKTNYFLNTLFESM